MLKSQETFARAGLLMLGDQLMWAQARRSDLWERESESTSQACSEFELLEDARASARPASAAFEKFSSLAAEELEGEIYIGLVGPRLENPTPLHAPRPPPFSLQRRPC